MSDLVERCENHGWHEDDAPLVWEMRDEIERLTAEVDAAEVGGAWHDHGIMVEQYKYWSAEARRLRAALVYFYNQGYSQGHEDTVEACYTDIHPADMHTYHSDVVYELAIEALKDD